MGTFLAGGGECGALIAARDWSATLGRVEDWPRSLKAATGLVLRSPVPMVMLWGKDGIMLYNDAYSVFAGGRHPELLGSKVREGWPEVADFNDHVMQVGLAGGTLSYKDQELTLYRNGAAEQVSMDLDYSPLLGDDGLPAGVLAIVIETTSRREAEARLAKRSDQLKAVADAALRITRAPTLEATLQEVVESARKVIGAHQSVVSMSRGRDWSQSINAVSLSEKYARWSDYDRVPDGRGIYAWVCEQNRPIRMTQAELEAHPRWRGFGEHAAEHPPMRGWLAAPLIGRDGRNLGLVQLSDKDGGSEFDAADEAVLVQLAQIASAAIEQSQAEESLRANEARLRSVLDNMGESFVLIDRDYRILDINAEALRLEDRSSAEILGYSHWEVWPNSFDAPSGVNHRRAMAERRPLEFEFEYAWPDGRSGWFEVRDYPTPDGLAIFYRDVTSRKHTEQQLRETARRLNAVLNNTTQAVFLMNDRQHCIFANAAAEKLTGYSFEQLSAKPLHDVIHNKKPDGSHYPLHECPIDRAFPEKAQVQGEELFVAPDGTFYPVAFTASPVLDDRGDPIGTVIEARNIAAEKTREEALRNSETRLRQVIEQMPIGVAVARIPGGEIVQYNQALEQILGHSILSSDASSYDRYGGIDEAGNPLPAHRYPLYRAIADLETVVNDEMRYRRGDGRIIHLLGNAAPIMGASGQAEIAVVTLQDITDRKKAEQHQRLLIDELSHRAKNLLAIIQSVAQQSFKGEGSPAELVSRFEGRLGALAAAHGILTKQKWEAAPIRQVICDTITAVKADDDRLKLDGPDIMLAPKTAVSMAMAVHELATNAVKYGCFSVEDGSLSVTWGVSEGRLHLEWRERGGPRVDPPSRRGFGSRMIERGLAAELGGRVRIDFHPDGVVCTVDAPFVEAAE